MNHWLKKNGLPVIQFDEAFWISNLDQLFWDAEWVKDPKYHRADDLWWIKYKLAYLPESHKAFYYENCSIFWGEVQVHMTCSMGNPLNPYFGYGIRPSKNSIHEKIAHQDNGLECMRNPTRHNVVPPVAEQIEEVRRSSPDKHLWYRLHYSEWLKEHGVS